MFSFLVTEPSAEYLSIRQKSGEKHRSVSCMQLLSGPRWAFRFHRAIITDTVCEKVVRVEMKASELDKVQQIQSNTRFNIPNFDMLRKLRKVKDI